ncbi:FtsK/SpoIIIE domain-containing protein, partial [Streptomyces sp. NPDC058439]|uniref:FtsK/SpoIIIE domain-containing protein n=1 Tax=Streptomyces sp. NPDC058439 TaxID=3346500 RepID=UPI003652DA1E
MTENPTIELSATATVIDLDAHRAAPSEAPTIVLTKPVVVEQRMADAAQENSDYAPIGSLAIEGPALWEAPEPAFPTWIFQRETLLGYLGAKRRQAWWLFKVHAVRKAPVYTWSATRRTGRGLRRTWLGAYGYLMATDYGHMIKDAKTERRHDLVVALRDQRRKTISTRVKSKRTAAVGIGVAAVLVVAAMYGYLELTAMAAGLAAFVAGGPDPTAPAETAAEMAAPPVPTDAYLNEAFRKIGILAKPNRDGEGGEVLRIVSPIVNDRDRAWMVVADLPGGKKASAAIAKREDIASAFGVDESQVHIERVRVSKSDGGHAGRFSLWISNEDPFGGAPVRTPLLKRESFDIWTDLVPVGLDARGRLVEIPMMWAALLVGAIPRQGKTFFIRNIALALALDPHVRHIVANGKGDRSWKSFKKIAHRYINGAGPEECKELLGALREVQRDMNRRNSILDGLTDEECPEDKLTPELAKKHGMQPTVIEVDELQRYLENPKHGDKILELLVDIAKVGPSTGYILMLATQRPDANCIPPALRDVIAYRAALKVMDWRSSEVILGAGTYGKGYDASAEEIGAHKGMALLVREDGVGSMLRGYLAEAYEAGTICERGRQLRVKAGTLTGDAAGASPAILDPTIERAELPIWLVAAEAILRETSPITPAALAEAV